MAKNEKDTNKSENVKDENTKDVNKEQVENEKTVNTEEKEEKPVKLEDLSIEELRSFVMFQKQINDNLQKENEKILKEKEEIKKLLSKSTNYLDQLVAMKNDFNSYKERIRADADRSRNEGKMIVIEKVLPFVDTLEKARVDITDGKAFELIYRQFTKILFEMGIEEIEVLDLPFDPNTANAITSREVSEDKKGTVVEIYQKGYKFGDKVLRYAQVIVGK